MKVLAALPSAMVALTAMITTAHTQLVVPFIQSTSTLSLQRHRGPYSFPTTEPISSAKLLPSPPPVAFPQADTTWRNDEPQPTRTSLSHTPHPIHARSPIYKRYSQEGINVDTRWDTDCHPDAEGYVYFSLAWENGTLTRTYDGELGLWYVTTEWYIKYTQTLREVIFNDPKPYEGCPNGHCRSKNLPGIPEEEPLRLVYIEDPEPLRHGWRGAKCQYDDSVRKIKKNAVMLGHIGWFIHGRTVPELVLDFVEAQMRATYPTLEITLVCICTIGFLPSIYILVVISRMLRRWYNMSLTGIPQAWASTKRSVAAAGRAMKAAPSKGCSKVKDACNWVTRRRSAHREAHTTNPPTYDLEEYPTSVPPSYKPYAHSGTSGNDESLPGYEQRVWATSFV